MRVFRRRRPRPIRDVVLYGKPGCHLCEEALALLQRISVTVPLRVRSVDITSDAELYRRYDIRIPVVEIDTVTALEAPISEEQLRDALDWRATTRRAGNPRDRWSSRR